MIEFTCGSCQDQLEKIAESLAGMLESYEMAHEDFEKNSPFAAGVLRGFFHGEIAKAKEILQEIRPDTQKE